MVDTVEAGRLLLADGGAAGFDECLWCTQAAPAGWVGGTGLPTGAVGVLTRGVSTLIKNWLITLSCSALPRYQFEVGVSIPWRRRLRGHACARCVPSTLGVGPSIPQTHFSRAPRSQKSCRGDIRCCRLLLTPGGTHFRVTRAVSVPVADSEGFIAIDEFLRCQGGPHDVFAVGDVASSAVDPRPKAGVFAVRQGPVLAENLRRYGIVELV